MAQKTHPKGFRLALNKDWESVWHDERQFSTLLEEDTKIRAYIQEKVGRAGIDELQILRSTNSLEININVARPGLVIGRGGSMITMIKEHLQKLTTGKMRLNVHEIAAPNLSPVLAVDSIVGAIERRYPYKRAVNNTIQRVMEAGAKGIKVFVSGRLRGNRIARRDKTQDGAIPTSTLKENVRYAAGFARTPKGTVGVKVWITQPEEE